MFGGASSRESSGVTTEPRLSYHPALDGLRAVAVLAVIAYHDAYAWAAGRVPRRRRVLRPLRVPHHHAARPRVPPGRHHRPARVLGPAAPAAAPGAAARPARGGGLQRDRGARRSSSTQLRGDSLASLFYVANWRFISTGSSYFDLFIAPSPVRHLWSLAIEEQFYLVWPLVVLGCLQARSAARAARCSRCRVAGIVASSIVMARALRQRRPVARVLRHRRAHPHDPGRRGARARVARPTAAHADRAPERADRRARRRGRDALVDALAVGPVVRVLPRWLAALRGRGRGADRGGRAAEPHRAAARARAHAARLDRSHLVRPLPLALAGQRVPDRSPHRVGRDPAQRGAARRHVRVRDRVVLPRRDADPARGAARATGPRWVAPVAIAGTGVVLVVATVGATSPPSYLGGGAAASCRRARPPRRA